MDTDGGEVVSDTGLGELSKALSAAQGEIEAAVKDSVNPHFRSRYADLASVWRAIRGPLSRHGLAVVQVPRLTDAGVSVETILIHAVSGQQIVGVLEIPVPQRTAQAIGSAITYARRFSLAAIVGVAPDDDDDEAAVRPAQRTIQPPVATTEAEDVFAAATTLEELKIAADQIATAYPDKTHPARVAARGAYARRRKELEASHE